MDGSTLNSTPLIVNVPAVISVAIPLESSGALSLMAAPRTALLPAIVALANCITLIEYEPITGFAPDTSAVRTVSSLEAAANSSNTMPNRKSCARLRKASNCVRRSLIRLFWLSSASICASNRIIGRRSIIISCLMMLPVSRPEMSPLTEKAPAIMSPSFLPAVTQIAVPWPAGSVATHARRR